MGQPHGFLSVLLRPRRPDMLLLLLRTILVLRWMEQFTPLQSASAAAAAGALILLLSNTS